MRVAVVEICRPEGFVMRCAWASKITKFDEWRDCAEGIILPNFWLERGRMYPLAPGNSTSLAVS
jgi:hypothetical protein